MNKITAQELLSQLNSNAAVRLIDVRTPAEFSAVHVVGAENIPLDEISSVTIEPSEKPLYILCHSGGRALKATQILTERGINRVYCVDGGTQAAVAAGVPVVRGACSVISLDRQMRIVAGSLILIGLILAQLASMKFLFLSAFVGAGLLFSGVTDICPMLSLLAKMPWNSGSPCCKK